MRISSFFADSVSISAYIITIGVHDLSAGEVEGKEDAVRAR